MAIRAVADTHAGLWYLYDDPRLSAPARALMDTAEAGGDQIAISSITLAEMVYLIEKGRIEATALERVLSYMREARARGVWFDLGHGAASFWFRNAKRAIDDGFPPDSISTDLHDGSVRTTVHSMLDAMSKCLAMGMPLSEVIERHWRARP